MGELVSHKRSKIAHQATLSRSPAPKNHLGSETPPLEYHVTEA